MMDIVKVAALLVLTLFAVGYALWIAVWFIRNQRPQKQGPARVSAPASRQDILGKSRFVLPPRRQPAPTAATESEDVKRAEKADIFVPGNVPQYPRQISPEKLDEVFGTPPAGESNDPEEVESPLVEVFVVEKHFEQHGRPLIMVERLLDAVYTDPFGEFLVMLLEERKQGFRSAAYSFQSVFHTFSRDESPQIYQIVVIFCSLLHKAVNSAVHQKSLLTASDGTPGLAVPHLGGYFDFRADLGNARIHRNAPQHLTHAILLDLGTVNIEHY